MSGWDERPDARSSRTRGAWEEYEDQTYEDGEYEDDEGNIISAKPKKSKAKKAIVLPKATPLVNAITKKTPSTVTKTTVMTNTVISSSDDSWNTPIAVHNPNEPSEAEQLAIDDLFGLSKDEDIVETDPAIPSVNDILNSLKNSKAPIVPASRQEPPVTVAEPTASWEDMADDVEIPTSRVVVPDSWEDED